MNTTPTLASKPGSETETPTLLPTLLTSSNKRLSAREKAIWLLLQSARDADGLPLLPMVTIHGAGGTGDPYKVPDAEGRIKLYSWVAALAEVADEDLVTVCELAKRLQAESRERYFRAGFLQQAALHLQQQRQQAAERQRLALEHQQYAEYQARRESAEAYLQSLSATEYAHLAGPVEDQICQRIREKRHLWDADVLAETVREALITQLISPDAPEALHVHQRQLQERKTL